MTSQPTTLSRPTESELAFEGSADDHSGAWLKPIHNPQRSALVASAAAKLVEAARRIEELNARVRELTQQAA